MDPDGFDGAALATIAERHPPECRRMHVDAGHSVKAFAIRLRQTVGRPGRKRRR